MKFQRWTKAITFSDVLLLCGFVAVCYGCAQVASWLAWVVGGAMLMVFAAARANAMAWLKLKRNRGE